MPLSPKRVAVGTTATRIDDADTVITLSILICNRGAASVFLGGPGVTATTGFELKVDEMTALELKSADGGLFGVIASGGPTTVRVDRLQVGS